MYCSKCGYENQKNASYCISCGENIGAQQASGDLNACSEQKDDERRAKMVAGTSNALGGVGRAVGSWFGAIAQGAKDGWNSEKSDSKDDDKKDE